jgi:4-hydroxy-2-oxovalerate aldolase
MKKNNPVVLECTLRDGSYVIDFQFTKEDTEIISCELANANFKYIEVGHGVGLGASKNGFNIAAATDEDYCKAVSGKLGDSSKWGMFCIPGIASIDDLKMAIDNNINFIRIGTDVNKIKESKDFIKLAKDNGVEVFANFMKSYILNPIDFAKLVDQSADYGSDCIYIVDSAGGMLPSQVRSFIRATFERNSDHILGFHGHNNLGLGMANALVSIEEGVKFIDSTLQGFGRSAGNVSTEHLVCMLETLNMNSNIDPIKVMDLGENLIRPLISQLGFSSLDITAGWAQFHSSFMPLVLKYARKERIDPRLLIKELCSTNKVSISEDIMNVVVESIKRKNIAYSNLKKWPTYFGEEENF